MRRFETELLEYVPAPGTPTCSHGIRDTGALPEGDALAAAVGDFKDAFVANRRPQPTRPPRADAAREARAAETPSE